MPINNLYQNILFTLILGIASNCKNKATNNENKAAETARGDTALFHKKLQSGSFVFEVSASGEGSLQLLTIKPAGFSENNKDIQLEADGMVTKAETADLDRDGFPELLVYTTSAGSGSYGSVIAYTVLQGRELSRIDFPETANHPEAGKGYMGHDTFAVVNSTLVQRFKVYDEHDSNSNPTGPLRTITYRMQKTKKTNRFLVDEVKDEK